MKESKKFLLIGCAAILGWFFVFILIHELGHLIAYVLSGCKIDSFKIDLMAISLLSECNSPEKLAIISVSGTLLSLVFWILLAQWKKNYWTSVSRFMTVFTESLNWTFGAFIYSSDMKTFSTAIGINPILLALIILPIAIISIAFLNKELKKKYEN